jgi:DNA-binding MarR family transcriptional regulator
VVHYSPLDIGQAIRRLDVALSQMHGEFSGRMRMTTQELLAIAHVSMSGSAGLGPSDLARRLHMTTGATTTLLDRLEARGHVERERHPTDRRKVIVHITPRARDEALAHVRPMNDEIMALAERLTDEERRIVGDFIDAAAAIIARHSTAPT